MELLPLLQGHLRLRGKGGDLYPGFIDAHTHVGLTTNGVGVESEDFNEESDPTASQLRITDDAIREIIRCYTRESGVRSLERCVAQICRKAER